MNIKVIIYDGIVHEVLTTEPAEVEIVNIDRDYEDYEALCRRISPQPASTLTPNCPEP